MLSNKIRIVIVALASAAALALPASALAQNPLEWSLSGGSDEQPYTFNTYTLGNVHRPLPCKQGNSSVETSIGCWQDLISGHQTFGVDLIWRNPAFDGVNNPIHAGNVQWKFVRKGNPRWPVIYPASCYQISGTAQVAIYDTARKQYLADGGSYLFGGTHIQWVSTPRYEWKVAVGLLEQPTYSTRVAQLYNTAEQGYLVQGGSSLGIDVRWLHAPYGLPYTYVPPAPCRLGPASAGATQGSGTTRSAALAATPHLP
jgi:hypothetical protein